MNRRVFSQIVALGAGTLGAWGESAGAASTASHAGGAPDQASPPPPPDERPPQPASVADFQRLAQARLPRATYEYITAGSTDENTLRENVAAFGRLRMLPPLLAGVDPVDTSTTVLKQRIALPILLAPVAGLGLYHEQGAAAAARAATAAGTIMGVSSSALSSVEEIAAAAAGPKWFQLYVPKDRVVARRLVERVERAGYKAIVLTVDLGERKDVDLRNRFRLPHAVLLKHLQDVGFPVTDRMSDDELMAFNDQAWDLSLSWKFFDWLRPITKLPLLLKGVLRADDARHAVSIGLDGIVVSNHGGRRLDGVPASIEQLPQVVDAVGGKADVLLDSGVRRGADVLKAIALGAKAVLIGRPLAWSLAADGEAGVKKVLDLLREELVSAMQACGCANVASIKRDLLLP
ncbi:MAG: alpha-hydroxy-acid oxidizing protein [Planctomycetia bacterium]|nr:alpha-hydroxy-acid oxidizing protein [Planctomycetia bacterium]